MKIFLVDDYKVNMYSLPRKIEDYYTINYSTSTGIEETLTITAEDNKWCISNSYDVEITKNLTAISKDILEDGNIYQVKFNDLNDYLKMYCYETPIKYFDFEFANKQEITVGKDKKCDIVYDGAFVSASEFKIYRSGNDWLIEDNGYKETKLYVNYIYTKKSVLNVGDVIFSNGLKVIWMGTFIRINNPNNLVSTTLKKLEIYGQNDNSFSPVSETDKNVVLYNDNQTFFHTPRIKADIVEKKIKISSPPDKEENEDPPAILLLGSTIMMGISSSIPGILAIFSVQKGEIFSAVVEIIICGTMLLGMILFPILLNKYNKKRYLKKEERRQKKYTEYLEKKKLEIKDEISKQTTILSENNLSIEQCQNRIQSKTSLWDREIQDDDFLTIRLGMGNKKASIVIDANIEDFSLIDDNLKNEVEKVLNTDMILENVPITISFIKNRIFPLIIDDNFKIKKQLIYSILLQLMTYYSPTDLKIVILTNDFEKNFWEFMKYTPYCMNSTRNNLFFATNEDEMQQLSNHLTEIYNERKRTKGINDNDSSEKFKNIYTQFNDYYLIITDDFVNAKKLEIIKNIVSDNFNVGFSLLTIEPSMKNVPSKSNKYLEVTNSGSIIASKDLTNDEKINFTLEVMQTENIEEYANIISNIPISFVDKKAMIPSYLEFLEMFKVGKIEQLNILNRWRENDPTLSLAGQIGIDEEGKPLFLDLHEKAHGPHGLIAGSTGSGKSEFIITYILSMAINYDPKEVQFVIIDYKGGGIAGAFENRETNQKIPHLIGTITNLDVSEMNRTLVSIKSELQRRQILFNEARNKLGESTVDIYKYQKFYRNGLVDEPVSHLFIISDEFAELKSQQPEFMNELISTARIGRSLGVHLILATQKPSGVVDDQIWSNSRFKVCLKVQTSEDSNELLKRPEAAYIKETGRFYLQIGYNESFVLAQSAWAGAQYYPTDKFIKNIDDSIKIVNNNGNIIKEINDNAKENVQKSSGDQLTNIVKTLYSISEKENLGSNYLWLPSIPKEIYISNLTNKYKYVPKPYEICPVIGEYDIPTKQLQELLTIDFTNTGNLIIYGNTGSGKENLIQTIIYSICTTHSSDEVNVYIIDLGAETLSIYQDYPQVGDIFLSNDLDKLDNMFEMLEREMNRRKDLFSKYGGNYSSFIKNSNQKIPLIMMIINGFESFSENSSNAFDKFASLSRDSSKFGICFVMSVIAVNSVPIKLAQAFSNVLVLQIADPLDYRFSFHAPEGLIPAKYFGRGIISMQDTAYEFQTAYIYEPNKINDAIKSVGQKLLSLNMKKARSVPIIPDRITTNHMLSHIDSIENVPLGMDTYSGEVIKYNFINEKITTILGMSLALKNKFILSLINILDSIPSIKLRVIDFSGFIRDIDSSIEYYAEDFTNVIKSIVQEELETKSKIIYILNGISYIHDKVLDEGVLEMNNIFSNLDKFNNSYFIVVENYSSYKKMQDELWVKLANKNNGIWVGNNIENQDVFTLNNLTETDMNVDENMDIYIINSNEYTIARGITTEGDDYY